MTDFAKTIRVEQSVKNVAKHFRTSALSHQSLSTVNVKKKGPDTTVGDFNKRTSTRTFIQGENLDHGEDHVTGARSTKDADREHDADLSSNVDKGDGAQQSLDILQILEANPKGTFLTRIYNDLEVNKEFDFDSFNLHAGNYDVLREQRIRDARNAIQLRAKRKLQKKTSHRRPADQSYQAPRLGVGRPRTKRITQSTAITMSQRGRSSVADAKSYMSGEFPMRVATTIKSGESEEDLQPLEFDFKLESIDEDNLKASNNQIKQVSIGLKEGSPLGGAGAKKKDLEMQLYEQGLLEDETRRAKLKKEKQARATFVKRMRLERLLENQKEDQKNVNNSVPQNLAQFHERCLEMFKTLAAAWIFFNDNKMEAHMQTIKFTRNASKLRGMASWERTRHYASIMKELQPEKTDTKRMAFDHFDPETAPMLDKVISTIRHRFITIGGFWKQIFDHQVKGVSIPKLEYAFRRMFDLRGKDLENVMNCVRVKQPDSQIIKLEDMSWINIWKQNKLGGGKEHRFLRLPKEEREELSRTLIQKHEVAFVHSWLKYNRFVNKEKSFQREKPRTISGKQERSNQSNISRRNHQFNQIQNIEDEQEEQKVDDPLKKYRITYEGFFNICSDVKGLPHPRFLWQDFGFKESNLVLLGDFVPAAAHLLGQFKQSILTHYKRIELAKDVLKPISFQHFINAVLGLGFEGPVHELYTLLCFSKGKEIPFDFLKSFHHIAPVEDQRTKITNQVLKYNQDRHYTTPLMSRRLERVEQIAMFNVRSKNVSGSTGRAIEVGCQTNNWFPSHFPYGRKRRSCGEVYPKTNATEFINSIKEKKGNITSRSVNRNNFMEPVDGPDKKDLSLAAKLNPSQHRNGENKTRRASEGVIDLPYGLSVLEYSREWVSAQIIQRAWRTHGRANMHKRILRENTVHRFRRLHAQEKITRWAKSYIRKRAYAVTRFARSWRNFKMRKFKQLWQAMAQGIYDLYARDQWGLLYSRGILKIKQQLKEEDDSASSSDDSDSSNSDSDSSNSDSNSDSDSGSGTATDIRATRKSEKRILSNPIVTKTGNLFLFAYNGASFGLLADRNKFISKAIWRNKDADNSSGSDDSNSDSDSDNNSSSDGSSNSSSNSSNTSSETDEVPEAAAVDVAVDHNVGLNDESKIDLELSGDLGFAPDDDLGFAPDDDLGFAPDDDLGFAPDDDLGFAPDDDLGLAPDDDLGLAPDDDLGFAPDDDLGLAPDDDLGLAPDDDLGLAPDDDLGFAPDDDLGFAPDDDLGFAPDEFVEVEEDKPDEDPEINQNNPDEDPEINQNNPDEDSGITEPTTIQQDPAEM